MPLSFPSSPTVGQTSTQNGRSYTYAGNNVWELTPASGVGSLSATVTIPGLGDPSFANVALLLKGQGSNGSTAITDSSSNPKSISTTGSVQISTAAAKYGSSSMLLSSGASVVAASSSDFAFGTGDFTVEFWWNVVALPTSEARLVNFGNTGLNLTYGNQSYTFTVVNESVAHIILTTQSVGLNQWHHVAYTRQSGTAYLYFNGTLLGSAGAGSVSFPTTTCGLSAGPGGTAYFSDFRVTNGVARYSGSASFTPPSATFPTASSLTLPVVGTGSIGSGSTSATVTIPAGGDAQWGSVVALLSGNGSLADSSIYGRTFSAYGDAAATGPAKFGSASISLDGDGDYLVAASSPSLDLGSNWTIECWVRPTSSTLTGAIVHRGVYEASNNSWTGLTASMRSLGSYIRFYFAGTSVSNEQYVDVQQSNFPVNTWTHVAMMRLGATGYVFVNGAVEGSVSSLANPVTSSQPLYVGTWYYTVGGADTYAGYWAGQIDELRITAAARYTSSGFTPQTAAFPTGFYTAAQTLPVVFS